MKIILDGYKLSADKMKQLVEFYKWNPDYFRKCIYDIGEWCMGRITDALLDERIEDTIFMDNTVFQAASQNKILIIE